MSEARPSTIPALDLSECAREPIHTPGSIQPHGILIAADFATSRITHISANASEWLGLDVSAAIGTTLEESLGGEAFATIEPALRNRAADRNPLYAGRLSPPPPGNGTFHAIVHRNGNALIVELEFVHSEHDPTFSTLYPLLHSSLNSLNEASTVDDLHARCAREFRRITGFDRVLVYQFDRDWNGHVVAENVVNDPAMQPYMDLWFPASDIPEQARELYRLNRLRLIADSRYRAVPIAASPDASKPLDLSFASLRSVSPVHLEYLRNMGVAASMSLSVIEDGKLWGLISCHHRTPRTVPFEIRAACDFLGQAFSIKLAALDHAREYERRIQLKAIMNGLLAGMAQERDFIEGLTSNPDDLLAFAGADGAAVMYEGRCSLLGSTPHEQQVLAIADWLLGAGRAEVYQTDCLSTLMPESDHLRRTASGLLAVSISQVHKSYVLWFRQEVVQTVTWGGDPTKPVEASPDGPLRLHPRKSFEAWRETVRGRSLPWRQAEIDTAAELRNAIIAIVLKKAEELAGLTAELQRSNKELEAFSYSVSHDLRAPFRHIVGYSELLRQHLGPSIDRQSERYVSTIIDSAHSAGMLVDHLLNYSRIGRSKLYISRVDMNALVREAIRDAKLDEPHRNIEWTVADLPVVAGDLSMMRVAVTNLVSNAVKYTRNRDTARIEIGRRDEASEIVFYVKDNGVGFNQKYVDKLFGVFQRLHREEEFEGSGIGLANVRRIIARHGGRTWAEGMLGEGATFFFSLPNPSPENS